MRLSINDFFTKFEEIRSFLWIILHLSKKSLMGNYTISAVIIFFFKMLLTERLKKIFLLKDM